MTLSNHTVEKIGGTSMSRFGELVDNIIIGKRQPSEYYNRIFVVSAYGGITNLLLEDKKNGQPGIYGLFAEDGDWQSMLEETRRKMIECNRSFESLGLDQNIADNFVNERLNGIKSCLEDLQQLRTFGHFQPKDFLPATREFLSAIGEAHSAFNSVEILKKKGINAVFVDLSGWRETTTGSIEDNIKRNLSNLDFSSCMPIVTGYAKCAEGIMNRFDRGYSEITFSKIAVATNAREGIIHKEFHLSTGDPKLIGADKVEIIGNTNFDIADQLADMAMEAIHPRAAKEMELRNIHIRVKNAFDPEHPGTLITKDYISPEPRVEMICGRQDVLAIELYDPEMVGQSGYDFKVLSIFFKYKISYIAKNTNANTITHFVAEKNKKIADCIAELAKLFPGAQILTREVSIVSVIGSNMRIPGFLSRAAGALAKNHINILALDQCMRQVNMQFMLEREHFNAAQVVLHHEFVEKQPA
ncbi:MAG: aspartate kinase [Victivallaceae bacterium]|nr:aspartate kinase [Victivallaceae bacterium]NLK83198.1 aspartate kinase [Lentisphaerota bacterium]MDD3116069.1 aspartate kinase [Victivallaceae bacterium]MDD3703623.1 aspartate kinase [Victivallaceae bacterium]MDD4317381.1 aspartate kinase [Victivallaceae bacterium]